MGRQIGPFLLTVIPLPYMPQWQNRYPTLLKGNYGIWLRQTGPCAARAAVAITTLGPVQFYPRKHPDQGSEGYAMLLTRA